MQNISFSESLSSKDNRLREETAYESPPEGKEFLQDSNKLREQDSKLKVMASDGGKQVTQADVGWGVGVAGARSCRAI